MNRSIQPPISPIENFYIPPLVESICRNGIPLYLLNTGEEEVIRVDIIFSSGSWEQTKKMQAMITNLLVKEGTAQYTSAQIAEKIDFYGASIQTTATHHHSFVTLYVLNKHAEIMFDLLQELVKAPSFPESELRTTLTRRKQAYYTEREKVQYLASRAFLSALYGADHPYGRNIEEADFDQLAANDLRTYHQQHYHSGNCRILISGKITDSISQSIERHLGDEPWGNYTLSHTSPDFRPTPSAEHRLLIPKEQALQSAIRLGIPCIHRKHPDFPKLKVVNTLLGGYFGSRLMSNIREEKGYTYGIGSGITVYQNAAYLCISTQTACQYTQPLIEEAYKEITRLQQEPVSQDELNMVKNYMIGEFCRSLESPFSIAEAYLSLLLASIDTNYLHYQIDCIKRITPEDILKGANDYLPLDSFYEIVAGKRD